MFHLQFMQLLQRFCKFNGFIVGVNGATIRASGSDYATEDKLAFLCQQLRVINAV